MSGIIKPGDPRFNGSGHGPVAQPPVDPRPIVAVLVPSGDMVHADFMVALISMLWHANNYARTMLLNFKGSAISYSRNVLVEMALRAPAPVDYVLFIDSDLVFPAETLGHLLKHGRSIVGATYARRKEPFDVLGRLKHIPGRDITAGGLHEAEAMPGGMMLVKTSVFRQVKRPWFEERYDYDADPWFISEDYGFSEKARAAGVSMWCDLTLSQHLGHLSLQAVKLPPLRPAQAAAAEGEMANG